jgi:hypothetical protein
MLRAILITLILSTTLQAQEVVQTPTVALPVQTMVGRVAPAYALGEPTRRQSGWMIMSPSKGPRDGSAIQIEIPHRLLFATEAEERVMSALQEKHFLSFKKKEITDQPPPLWVEITGVAVYHDKLSYFLVTSWSPLTQAVPTATLPKGIKE